MIVGKVELDRKFANMLDDATYDQALREACGLVMAAAVANAPGDTGELKRSITYEVEDKTGVVGTNLFYAPYVHQGTGTFAKDGNGREGYWVFVKGEGATASSGERKIYTLEEARKIMAMLRSQGLEAYYTNGQKPNPFLEKALDDNEEAVLDCFKNKIKEAAED